MNDTKNDVITGNNKMRSVYVLLYSAEAGLIYAADEWKYVAEHYVENFLKPYFEANPDHEVWKEFGIPSIEDCYNPKYCEQLDNMLFEETEPLKIIEVCWLSHQ